jgi:hypothetical protein
MQDDREVRTVDIDWEIRIAPRLRALRELEPPPRLRERVAAMLAAGRDPVLN